ncbi:MAG: C_GCAxxG_C_C family protein [Firmicutes bacterium]|nr:C_GCAxxG_C_C family protein [Bacillota bacterium]
MSDKTIKANDLHNRGYNCAQAVACVFAEDMGMSEEDVFRIMEGFGFGMGTMGTCGAVSAMAAVVGMNRSDGNLEKPRSKKDSYKDMRSLTEKFHEKNGSIMCRDIKGVDTGVVLRSCPGCIEDCVEILEAYVGR